MIVAARLCVATMLLLAVIVTVSAAAGKGDFEFSQARETKKPSLDEIVNHVVYTMESCKPTNLLPLVDDKTMYIYHSELPEGGIYKGRRGWLEASERYHETVVPISASCNITGVDHGLGTAVIECLFKEEMRRTHKAYEVKGMIVLTTALGKIRELEITVFDYNKMMDFYRTSAESHLHAMNTAFTLHGPTSPEALALIADNITITFSAVNKPNLIRLRGKDDMINAFNSSKDKGVWKLVDWIHNRTAHCERILADGNTVVSLSFAGDTNDSRHKFDHASEGIFLKGPGTEEFLCTYHMFVFDNAGLLMAYHGLISNPLTPLTLFRLKTHYNILLDQ